MQSINSKQTSGKVHFIISVCTPNQLVPNMTIAAQNHLTSPGVYLKVRVKFQVMAHQTLYTLTFWHFHNCCCHLCLLVTLMQLKPIPMSPPCSGRSHVHGNSRMTMINCRSLVYRKVHPPLPSDWCRIPTGICMHNKQNPMSTIIIRWMLHACTKT